MLGVPLALVAGALAYWQSLAGKVSTDNAYIKQDMVAVSAEVGGRIVAVEVADGSQVQAGDLLFRIDPEPFRLQLAEADAAIAGAQANVIALSNASELTGTDIEAARSDVRFAEARFERVRALREKGFSTKADYEAAAQARTRRSPPPKRAAPMPNSPCAAPKCAHPPPGGSRRPSVCRWASRSSPTCPC